MQVFFDELDESYDDVSRCDLEDWFDNSYEEKKYVMFGRMETWDIKGEDAVGYSDKVYSSILECIDDAREGLGVSYLKVYEKDDGRLFLKITHHDGVSDLEIKELTDKGEDIYLNNSYDEDIVKKLIFVEEYNSNVNFRERYW